jgi:two-component sensor histidine kinase
MVTELVTNSLKHAFGEAGGRIEVILETDETRGLTLVVADDGRAGSAAAFAPGLGTTLLQGFVSQLGARLTVTRDRGTRTAIEIPAGSVG